MAAAKRGRVVFREKKSRGVNSLLLPKHQQFLRKYPETEGKGTPEAAGNEFSSMGILGGNRKCET